MCVAADHDLDIGRQPVGDPPDRAVEIITAVRVRIARLLAAFVDQQDDRPHALLFQCLCVCIGGGRFVEKLESTNTRWRDDPRRIPECLADEADLDAGNRPDRGRRQERRRILSLRLAHVRRQILKRRAGETVAVLTTVRG